MSDDYLTSNSGRRWTYVAAWTVVLLLLVATMVGGGVLAYRNIGEGQAVEVLLPQEPSAAVEVYLSGAVESEGIYSFTQDSSLAEVLGRGGISPEGPDAVGLRVYVLGAGEDPFDQGQDDGGDADCRINVNRASSEELQELDGIGPVKAQAIIDYRGEHGPFRPVDDLINVSGIGPKTLEKIRDQVTVVD